MSAFCEKNNVGLIILRQYGLLGYIRVFKSEVAVIESKPADVNIDDLRLTNPFPALEEFALSINFNELDEKVHAHIPYNVILIQALHQWKSTVSDHS